MNIRLTLGSILLLALTFFASGPSTVSAQSTSYSVSDFENAVVAATNADRAAHGLAPVTFNATLSAAAEQKADDMMQKQYFAHISPSGQTPWFWFRQSGYTYIYAGENLAMDFYTPSSVEAAWMNSPTHRANILNGKYKEIGLGLTQGTYQGKPALFIVEFFGTQLHSTN